jgi:aminoglycoside 2'-N-acetyltransferase I
VTHTRMIRLLPSEELTVREVESLRALFAAAWPEPEDRFSDEDWHHALGGIHVLAEVAGRIVSHAAVVERVLTVGGRAMRAGYVEAVATWPDRQRRGHGSAVMREIDSVIETDFELGLLGTGEHGFYERLGWLRWRGPSSVALPDGSVQPTPDDDGYLMALPTARSPKPDLDAPIVCRWRLGDVW